MNKRALGADVLLLLTAGIWGFGFVAQRSGMEYIGPFAFNGIRFLLGSLSLLPLIAWRN
ncbi:MAG: EamA family transporter, partial [Treponema sp.]|nr:EamA family transporter [Treponema sp.]